MRLFPKYYAVNSLGYSPGVDSGYQELYRKDCPSLHQPMIEDYEEKFYSKLEKQFKLVSANNFAKAKEIAAWQLKVARAWDNIEIVSTNTLEKGMYVPAVGQPFSLNAVIDVKDPDLVDSIGVDMVLITRNARTRMCLIVQSLPSWSEGGYQALLPG